MPCYDRASEREKFEHCDKDIIFFSNAKGNGMTIFLKTVLQNKQYIFIRENCKGDIVFDLGDATTTGYEAVRKSFLDIEIEKLEKAETFLNLFYLIDMGTFFRNVGVDMANKRIKSLKYIKYTFENFLSDYMLLNIEDQTVHIIVDHANNNSKAFIEKVKNLLGFGKIKLIFTFDEIVKAEFSDVFTEYEELDFSKPNYDKALIIFDNLKMDKNFYDREMYNGSSNLFGFMAAYQTRVREADNPVDASSVIIRYLNQIPCLYNKAVFNLLCRYLLENACVDVVNAADEFFEQLLGKCAIVEKDGFYCTTESYKKNIQADDFFIAFAYYALNFFNQLPHDFLFYLYKILSKLNPLLGGDAIAYLLSESNTESEIKDIVAYSENLGYYAYLKICRELFKRRHKDFLYHYKGEIDKNKRPFNELLKLIIDDRRRLPISPAEFRKKLVLCFNKYGNTDIRCLLAIIYLDFCINHDKKQVKKFTNEKAVFYYENFSQSKYYCILESIIAFYVPNSTIALTLYNCAIASVNGYEQINILNNKFAYVLSKHINTGLFEQETEQIYTELTSAPNSWLLKNNFFNTNLILYQSIKANKNKYKTDKIFLECAETCDFYKLLNGKILDFVFSDAFDIKDYLNLEKAVTSTNRAPTKNIYYYNLFVMACYTKNKFLIKKARKFLETDKDFVCSNIYTAYKKINPNSLCDRRSAVRFGYIFSRLNETYYIFDEVLKDTAVSIR